MHLGFINYSNDNNSFKRSLARYNHLLKNYFENDDVTISKKLNETFDILIESSLSHEILSEKESEVYNIIIDFMANDLNELQLENIKNQVFNDDIKEKIIEKISKELNDVSPEILKSVMEKSNKLSAQGNSQSMEIIFIPSVVNIKEK